METIYLPDLGPAHEVAECACVESENSLVTGVHVTPDPFRRILRLRVDFQLAQDLCELFHADIHGVTSCSVGRPGEQQWRKESFATEYPLFRHPFRRRPVM